MAVTTAPSQIETRPVAQPRAPGRLHFVEGMRGLAALYVVLQHICTMVDPYQGMLRDGARPLWLSMVMSPLWYGHFAVAVFIVLSGFCLQVSLYNRRTEIVTDPKAFFWRRCRRILPPYYACLALSLLTCYLITQHQTGMPFAQYLPVTTQNLTSHLLMVHNLDPDWMYKINGVLWSIAIEFQLYFFFPTFSKMMKRLGKPVTLTFLGLVAAIMLMQFPWMKKLYVWYIPLFGLGMIAAGMTRTTGQRGLILGASSMLFLMSAIYFKNAEMHISDSLIGISIAFLLVAGATARTPMVGLFASRPLVLLGTFSYSLYLMHHPILQTIYVYRPTWASTMPRQFAYLIILGLPIILIACYAFHWLFERPFTGGQSRADKHTS